MRHTQKRGTIVSPVPITLRIVSPLLPALSMVDMPGLTKVPIDGQPKSIVQELENMARDYVKHENVIILAVTPANADLATSDALRLAREVDPTGERTIGVYCLAAASPWSSSVSCCCPELLAAVLPAAGGRAGCCTKASRALAAARGAMASLKRLPQQHALFLLSHTPPDSLGPR
jgi:hypothetical protein